MNASAPGNGPTDRGASPNSLAAAHGARAELLVLTQSRPSWDGVVEQAGWPGADGGGARIADYSRVLDLVQRGREFRFRVRVNPVHSVRGPAADGERQRSVRVGHSTARHQESWFFDRVARWGFEVPLVDDELTDGRRAAALVERNRLRFWKGGSDRGGRPIVLSTAVFEGVLRVTDADLLRASLLSGIGPAKGYGCGLLTLAPVQPGAAL